METRGDLRCCFLLGSSPARGVQNREVECTGK
uniref:Uncharacterized protein n=1 Tax=Arundo donax TaxID=35708 RepID=A0A0A8Z4Y4_ARUDO